MKEPKFNLISNNVSQDVFEVKDYNKKIIQIPQVEREKHKMFLKKELKKNFY